MHPNTSKMILRLSLLPLALICFCAIAMTQELTTGSMVGVVKEESGSIVSGASITVTNRATGAQRSATSGEAGEFSIPGLAPALYRRLERPGHSVSVLGLPLLGHGGECA